MSELKECKDEIARLKEIIAVLEAQKEVRAARVEFGANKRKALLHIVVTYPSSVDEYSFGMFILQHMSHVLSAIGAKNVTPVGTPVITPQGGEA